MIKPAIVKHAKQTSNFNKKASEATEKFEQLRNQAKELLEKMEQIEKIEDSINVADDYKDEL